jgi:cysteine desulfurase
LIYLDYAATTPMSLEATEAFLHTAKTYFHNTESLHDGGLNARQLLEHARTQLADMIGREPEGVYFTGGGSDGNFLALTSLAMGAQHRGKHILTTTIEHPSVEYALAFLEKNGFEVTRVPVESTGVLSYKRTEEVIRPDTVLATIQHVNSETGIMQDIKGLGELFKKKKIIFHSDCVQSFTKFNTDYFQSFQLDSLTVSAHKVNGPKGTGAVFISPSLHIAPLLAEVTHERGFRPGTVDLPSVVSFVTAANEALKEQKFSFNHVVEMRNFFLSLILGNKDIIFEGHNDSSPYILPLRVRGVEGQIVMQELNRRQIAVSTGSACQNGQQTPSRALLALGRTVNDAHGLVRISISHLTTREEIHTLAMALNDIVMKLLAVRGVTKG